jgi:hypothetical protein
MFLINMIIYKESCDYMQKPTGKISPVSWEAVFRPRNKSDLLVVCIPFTKIK